MEKPNNNSSWALVIRDDGDARVVPYENVSAMDPDASADAKSSAVIVWQADEQAALSKGSTINLSTSESLTTGLEQKTLEKHSDHAAYISLSPTQVAEIANQLGGTVITIADGTDISGGLDSLEEVKNNILKDTSLTPVTTDIVACEASVMHGDFIEPTHVIRIHASHEPVNLREPECQRSIHACSSKIHVTPFSEMKAPDSDRGGGTICKDRVEMEWNKDFDEDQIWKREDYNHQIQSWTRRLTSSSESSYEPFERVDAVLHRDVISKLGIQPDKGIFLNLHQQGAARGIRVSETGSNQIVVSGSLVELLASRDMILTEIEKIRGESRESNTYMTAETGTREIGVMCELIPSPPMTRYASSLGLDRSARRYHSVLSRPLSPEPRPQRRKSRRHMLSNHKEKSSERNKVLRNLSGRYKVQMQNQNPSKSCSVKSEKDCDENVPNTSCLGSDVIVPGVAVELLLDSMKTEPCCDVPDNISGTQNPDSQLADPYDMNDLKSMVSVVNSDGVYSVSSIPKDISLRLTEDRLSRLKHSSKGIGLNNKENLGVHFGHHKSKEQSIIETGDVDSESIDKVCEMEVDMSEANGEAFSKSKPSKEIKYKFSCTICSYKSMRESHFLKHMMLHDKGLALYRCNECSFVSIRASHLRRHTMSHAIQVLRCHLCTYTCDDKKLLAKHVRVRHKTSKQQRSNGSKCESPEVFECSDCDYKTTWPYLFQRHRRTHNSSKMIDTHSCSQCSYKTMRREHFLRHIMNVHQNHRPFLCDICGKAFKRQDALKQHHVTHYQNVGDSGGSGQMGPYGFVCSICRKVCRSAAYLKEHMATHSEERSFLCEICGASFKTRNVQRNHVRTIHRLPRAFTCMSCEKKFNTKFALRRHMKQHDVNLEDGEGLTDITATPRLCGLQHSLEPSSHLSSENIAVPDKDRNIIPTASTIASSHPPTSAYQITIDGEPAFIVPHIDAPHTTVEEGESTIIADTNTVFVEENVTSNPELSSLTSHSNRSNPISVPVVPSTVHIVEQDHLSTASSDLILSPSHYEATRSSRTSANDTTNYVNPEHSNSTLLYLTANFE